MSIIFGPIPSRRLGRSLGINNIPPKVCSYACIYCQIGNTNSLSISRKAFYNPVEIANEITERINTLKNNNEKIDYISFVPDGEPTLDINLGKEINLLKQLGIKIAVITNSSLLWDKKVREDLLNADWVSVKVDTVEERTWQKIDRPYGKLNLNTILEGIKSFASEYKGILVTETMLVKDINDDFNSLQKTADFIKEINPKTAYILVPTRPPAEEYVKVPSEENLNMAYQIYSDLLDKVELLISGEGSDFSYFSDVEKEIVSILSVHPMRKEAVDKFLNKANANWQVIQNLIDNKVLKEINYSGSLFLVKNITSNKNR